MSCFLLSGRAWTVLHVQHEDRRVIVAAAPRGRQPTWGGFLPQFLGHTLCQRILAVLTGDQDYAWLSQPAREALAMRRAEMRDILAPGSGGIELDHEEIRWWTFAGGAINSTLRHALKYLQDDWTITADNTLVRLRGANVGGLTFQGALGSLGQPGFWDNEDLWQVIAQSLPNYRLSKFQPLMPPWVERETLARYLLDIPNTQAWLARSMGRTTHDLVRHVRP